MIINIICTTMMMTMYMILCMFLITLMYTITTTFTKLGGKHMNEMVELKMESINELLHKSVSVLENGTYAEQVEIKNEILNTFTDRKTGRVPEVSSIVDVEDDNIITVSYSFISNKKTLKTVPKTLKENIMANVILCHFVSNFEEYKIDMLNRMETENKHNKHLNIRPSTSIPLKREEKTHDCGCVEDCQDCKCK